MAMGAPSIGDVKRQMREQGVLGALPAPRIGQPWRAYNHDANQTKEPGNKERLMALRPEMHFVITSV
jgi:hypothetical protein